MEFTQFMFGKSSVILLEKDNQAVPAYEGKIIVKGSHLSNDEEVNIKSQKLTLLGDSTSFQGHEFQRHGKRLLLIEWKDPISQEVCLIRVRDNKVVVTKKEKGELENIAKDSDATFEMQRVGKKQNVYLKNEKTSKYIEFYENYARLTEDVSKAAEFLLTPKSYRGV